MKFSEIAEPRKELYFVSEVARILGVGKWTLYTEMRAGRLKYLQRGERGRLIRPGWVDEWMEGGARETAER